MQAIITALIANAPATIAPETPVVVPGQPVAPEQTPTPAKPPMYAVILHNDHTTFPDFVNRVMQQAFSVEGAIVSQITMAAHLGDRAVVKICPKDMAETQLARANAMIAAAEPGRDFYSRRTSCELTFSIELETEGDK